MPPDLASPQPTRSSDRGAVLVLGASGYVGGRLVPELCATGTKVRCMTRSRGSLESIEWACDVDIVEGDLLDPETLHEAFAGIEQVVYLVHSLDQGEGFEATERACARNARVAATRAGVHRFVYLSGLGDDTAELSPHLRSRHVVGAELAAGDVAVTELRAAVILGAGSASFEMLRSLTDVLPVMVAPTWVTRSQVQPIAISDVLQYLMAALDEPIDWPLEETPPNGTVETTGVDTAGVDATHRIVEIGGPDRLTYREMIELYADAAGLPPRRILSVPFVTPRLSSHWVNVVTPLPKALATQLIDSLRHDVVVTDDSASLLSEHRPLDARTAIGVSIAAIEDLDIPTRWSGVSSLTRSAQPRPWDPDWSGGTVLEDRRVVDTHAAGDQVMRTVRGIGGDRGWYGFGPLWAIRGAADKLVGGVGLRRGRRHPDEIIVGEALDFWRVDALTDDLFRLRAEMKLPGMAWLEWSIEPSDDRDRPVRVVQRARYAPNGLAGRLYWWALLPFHAVIFPIMLRRVVGAAEDAAASTPPGE